MNFEDVKEYLGAEWERTRSKLEDNPTVQRLQEAFQNLSSGAQRGVIIGVVLGIALVLLSVPWGYFSSSNENLSTFDSHRESLQDFYKTERESTFLNEIPPSATPQEIQTSIQNQLQTMSILPEQITPMETKDSTKSNLIPKDIVQNELVVQLKALNVKQISDVGAQIQTIHPLIRMKDISIKSSVEHPHYFDVSYTLLLLKGKTL